MVTKQTNRRGDVVPRASVRPDLSDGGDEGLRSRNLQAALQHVYRESVTTRAVLSRLTGLTRATMSELVAKLLTAGLVREAGLGTSSGGKRPTLLELNASGREIVAIDLSSRPFGGASVDLAGRINHRAHGRKGELQGADALQDVFRLVDGLVARADAPILGIGVGTPGIVDEDGSVVEASNLGWHGVALRRELAERMGHPVTVANDAHAGALAELGADHNGNLVLVKVGVGIGAGIVVDGDLHLGDRPAAGEIGHIRVVERGARCHCGNVGCLETVASVPNIVASAIAASGRDVDANSLPWSLDALSTALGEAPVRAAIARAGRSLGAVLSHLVAILDIHRVVIALEIAGAGEAFLAVVRDEVRKRVLPDLANAVEFTPGTTGSDLVLSGAAALVLRERLGVSWR
jgi:predicted NBD/HSP70 family sugar kinase